MTRTRWAALFVAVLFLVIFAVVLSQTWIPVEEAITEHTTTTDRSTSSQTTERSTEEGTPSTTERSSEETTFTTEEKKLLPRVFEGIAVSGVYNASPVEVVVDVPFPEFPAEVALYRVVKPGVDEGYAADVARQLGFNGTLVPLRGEKREVYAYVNETHTLEIRLDGSLMFYKDIKLRAPESLPSEQDCIAIAERWLRTHNLYPENVVEVETKPCLMIDGTPITIGVTFDVAVRGYELHGLGVLVVIGDGGEIVDVRRNVPQLELYRSVRLKTLDEALGILKHYLTSPSPLSPGELECIINMRAFTRLTVQNITLRYFNDAGYLQPVYTFTGDAYDQYSPDLGSFLGLVDGVDRSVDP